MLMTDPAAGLSSPNSDELLVLPEPETDLSWYCLHTRSRREKKVARACELHALRHYLPLRKSVRQYGRIRRVSLVPYFPGYLFCCASPDDRHDLIAAGDLANAIQVNDQESLLCDLQQVRKALRASDEVRLFPYLKRGQRVRIVRGPFRDVEGIVSRRRGAFRVVLNVNFIRSALAVEVDADAVEPV